jgi:hypothetical protein
MRFRPTPTGQKSIVVLYRQKFWNKITDDMKRKHFLTSLAFVYTEFPGQPSRMGRSPWRPHPCRNRGLRCSYLRASSTQRRFHHHNHHDLYPSHARTPIPTPVARHPQPRTPSLQTPRTVITEVEIAQVDPIHHLTSMLQSQGIRTPLANPSQSKNYIGVLPHQI